MKAVRQRKIVELITKNAIETQEELAIYLAKEGFPVTQATVSRDIRELALEKVSIDGKRQKYALPSRQAVNVRQKYISVLREGILKMEGAENILVVHTVSGMAMAVGAAIDAMDIEEIIGCLAGDDTIFCVIRSAADTGKVENKLKAIIF